MFYGATRMIATIAVPSCAENANADVFIFDRGDGVSTSTAADGATVLTFKGVVGDEVVVTLSADDRSVSACFVLPTELASLLSPARPMVATGGARSELVSGTCGPCWRCW